MNGPTRNYHSPRREQDAARTRQDILTTARDLFLERGYARVTMADIARAVGIAVKTVYASVGTKSNVLREIVAAGAAQSTSVDGLAHVRAAPDLETAVRLVAHGTRVDKERFGASIELLRSARDSDDEAQQAWRELVTAYRGALREAATSLVERGLTAPDLHVEAATDRLWFYFGPAAWHELVHECGWTYDEAEAWLTRHALTALDG